MTKTLKEQAQEILSKEINRPFNRSKNRFILSFPKSFIDLMELLGKDHTEFIVKVNRHPGETTKTGHSKYSADIKALPNSFGFSNDEIETPE